MNPKPPPEINIRERLRELGYLDNTVARFVAGSPEGRTRPAFMGVVFRASVVGWLALALLTLGATVIVNPFLIRHPLELLYLTLGLGLANLILSVVFSFLFCGFALLLLRITGLARLPSRRLAAAVAFCASASVFAYLTFWWVENSAFGRGAELMSLPNIAFVIVAFLIAALFYRVTLVAALVVVLRKGSLLQEQARGGSGALRWGALVLMAFIGFFAFLYGSATQGNQDRESDAAVPRMAHPPARPVMLIGIEGPESREALRYLLNNNRLPSLSRLAEEGVMLNLSSGPECDPPPVVWNTISTGVPPAVHGITGYEETIPAGLSRHIEVTRKHIGLYQILKIVLPALRLTRTVPLSSQHRDSLTTWEIASRAGLDVGVVNWWASWPPDDVSGFFVTDRAFLSLARPPESAQPDSTTAYADDAPASVWEGAFVECESAAGEIPDVTAGLREVIRNARQMDCFHSRAGAELYRIEKPSFYGLFLQGPDIVEHALKTSGSVPIFQQGAILDDYYSRLDDGLSAQIAAAATGTVFIIAILPGLDPLTDHCNEGACIVSIPGTRLVSPDLDMNVLDIAPTILALLGIPPSREMPGRIHPVAGAIDPSAQELDKQRPDRYPVRIRPRRDGLSFIQDDAYLERLKTLGYLE